MFAVRYEHPPSLLPRSENNSTPLIDKKKKYTLSSLNVPDSHLPELNGNSLIWKKMVHITSKTLVKLIVKGHPNLHNAQGWRAAGSELLLLFVWGGVVVYKYAM